MATVIYTNGGQICKCNLPNMEMMNNFIEKLGARCLGVVIWEAKAC